MSRANNKGRSKGSPHVRLDHSVFHSAAYRALAPVERVMLLELTGLYNGSNNGELWLGVRDAAKLIGVADPETAGRALKVLLDHGFVAVARPGHFNIKERHATCYRLTFLPARGAGPTSEYRDWQAEAGTPAAARLIATGECKLRSGFSGLSVGKIRTEVATAPNAGTPSVRNNRTDRIETSRFSSATSVGNIPTQIMCHPLGTAKASSEACKTAAGLARAWIDREGVGAQGRLAGLAGLHASKLSRFLSDETGRRSLTIEQCERLRDAALTRGHLRAVA